MPQLTYNNDDDDIFSKSAIFGEDADNDDYDDDDMSYEELMGGSSHHEGRVVGVHDSVVHEKPYAKYIGWALIGVCGVLLLGFVVLFFLSTCSSPQEEAITSSDDSQQYEIDPNALSWEDLQGRTLYLSLLTSSGEPFVNVEQTVSLSQGTATISVTNLEVFVDEETSENSASVEAAKETFENLVMSGPLEDSSVAEPVGMDATELFDLSVLALGADPDGDDGFSWLSDEYKQIIATPTEDGLNITFDLDGIMTLIEGAPQDVVDANYGVKALKSASALTSTNLYLDETEAEASAQKSGSDAEISYAEMQQAEEDAYEDSISGTISKNGIILSTDSPVINLPAGEETEITFIIESSGASPATFPIVLPNPDNSLGWSAPASTVSTKASALTGSPVIERNFDGTYQIEQMQTGDQVAWTWTFNISSSEEPGIGEVTMNITGSDGSGKDTVLMEIPLKIVVS